MALLEAQGMPLQSRCQSAIFAAGAYIPIILANTETLVELVITIVTFAIENCVNFYEQFNYVMLMIRFAMLQEFIT